MLKRNTDCVYFLASPLTCKKGVDCEYRHSEIARMNPRDCWYWLSGNCLNPTCGFRHPPMDSNSETSAEAEHLPNKTSLPSTKNNVPCYFYFNGYCGKGDKCTFLHHSEATSARKLKKDSSSTVAHTLTRKSPYEASVPKITNEKPDTKLSSTLVEHNVPSEFEEPAMFNLASLDPPEYSDESSEDQVEKDSVRDEWWESSPGFDVLVEGNSEGVNYGVEQEYMHVYNMEDQFLDPHYREYGDRLLHENRIREASYYSDEDERYDLHDYYHRDRGRNHVMSQKRKLPTIGLPIGGHHYCEDLREHLSKRRYHEERDLHTQETPREPQRSSDAFVIIPEQKGRARNKEIKTRDNHHHERKRLQNQSRVQRTPFSRKKKESNNNVSFAPPKTLAQIKEDKYRRRSSTGGEEDVNIIF